MQSEQSPARRHYIRPLALAAVFTVAGETMVVVLWGLVLFPGGSILAKLLSAGAAAIIMAVGIGLMVGFVVGGRFKGPVAAVVSSLCYATVLAAGILISYEIDMAIDIFGVRRDPTLFVLTGIVPAILSAPLYGWLLHGDLGKDLLARLGL